ncbi:MAG: class II aldolase/adducin family protein [Methylocystaceae bacterium]|nr:MAG: class II aldolase/adducin family protein [Methylocystaceae bacterium]
MSRALAGSGDAPGAFAPSSLRPAVYSAPHVGRRLAFELPPQKETVEEERLHRKQRLAASFRLFARNGFSTGVAGHITARDPQWSDHFWVNPLGVHFSQIRVSDLLLVDRKGEIVEGEGFLNGAAFAIHSELHEARPDVVAAAHAHSLYGKTWSTLGRLLDPISQDSCMFYNDHALYDDYSGVVLELSEGARIAAALGDRRAVILQNHGFLTVGRTVESAAFSYVAMERAAQSQILAESIGAPRELSAEVAERTRGQVGGDFVSWLCFLSQWDVILREEPDFLL